MSIDDSIVLRIEHQRYGRSFRDLSREYGYALSTVYRHAIKALPNAENPQPLDKRRNNPGRPRIIDDRRQRSVQRAVSVLRKSQGPSFSADQVRAEANIFDASRVTVNRCLHKLGYKRRNLRKKGILTDKDLRIRLKYSRDMLQNHTPDFWTDHITMFLDGVGFAHKVNPYSAALRHGSVGYRKRNEGLKVTARGSKEGVNGKLANFYVGISHGQGVVFCSQYIGPKVDGARFAEFVTERFPQVFENVGKSNKFVQDGCPVQNSRIVKDALREMNLEVISIPARSPDLNPVENLFNNVRRDLRQQAIDRKIYRESYGQFCMRVRDTLLKYNVDTIDKSIANMHSRFQQIIQNQGRRSKY